MLAIQKRTGRLFSHPGPFSIISGKLYIHFRNDPLLRGQDLNLRPLGYEPSELPNCSTPRHMKSLARGWRSVYLLRANTLFSAVTSAASAVA